MEKLCSVCKIVKDVNDFYKREGGKFGRSHECKQCCKRYKKTPEAKKRRSEYLSIKRKADPEPFKERDRAYRKRLDPALKAWRQAKNRSQRKGIEFDIEPSDLIVPDKCPLLEIELVAGVKGNYMNTYSIDRIDSSKGYIKGNVQILSMKANNMKSSANVEELLIFSKNIILMNKEHSIVKELIENLNKTTK